MDSSTQATATGLVISRDADLVRAMYSDGSHLDMPNAGWPDLESTLDQVIVSFRPAAIILRSRATDFIYPEMPRPGFMAPVGSRPIVYLDQNHWSTLSKARFDPARVSTSELAAAQRVLKLAESSRIILPLSSGHLSETGAWGDDESRYRLGITMLQMSHGWQLRDPTDVRRHEFIGALRSAAGLAPLDAGEVVTLEPWSIHADVEELDTPGPFAGLGASEELRFLFDVLLSMNVYASMFLNMTPIPGGAPEGWTKTQQRFTDWLAGETGRAKQMKRKSAEVFALSDITRELAAAAADAGVTPSQMSDWTLNHWWANKIDAMPATMMFRSILVDKHLDPATKWEDNDLTDLWFLAAAAGYSDYVVAERRTVALLSQAKRRLHAPVKIARTLSELIELLPTELKI